MVGDSVTTDHISPAGSIKKDSPAGKFLMDHKVGPIDFNSYGSRRGDYRVMTRGTFANIRLRNQLAPGTEGGVTKKDGEEMSIYDASVAYIEEGVPLVVLGGKEYGSGSSRDWAAKGTSLLGVRAVIAENFERIHRSNLVGMGVLPCSFRNGDNAQSLGLDGSETVELTGLANGKSKTAQIVAKRSDGTEIRFEVDVLLLTPKEVEYFRHGGLLHYVLRQLAAKKVV
jgi:aconitate hydratase